jgi:WD40 repeat protein
VSEMPTGNERLSFLAPGTTYFWRSRLAIGPDGKRIAFGEINDAFVLNARTGARSKSFTDLKATSAVCFSTDGQRLAQGCADGSIVVLQENAALEQHVSQHTGPFRETRFRTFVLADGKPTRGGQIDVVKNVFIDDLGRSLGPVKPACGARSADGKLIATCGQDQIVKVWDDETGAGIQSFPGHGKPIDDAGFDGFKFRIDFSPDGKRIVSGGDDAYARVWDIQTGQEKIALWCRFPIEHVSFSPDGTRIATVCRQGMVRLWDSQTGQELLALKLVALKSAGSRSGMLYSSDGDRIYLQGYTPETDLVFDASPPAKH